MPLTLNLWLCEHVDLKFLDELCESECFDVLVHGGALSKYRATSRRIPVSPMHWLIENDLQKYSIEKIKRGRRSRERISKIFSTLCDVNKPPVDPMFAGVIERLFFPCNQGCLDALAFALSYPRFLEGRGTKIRVIVGGNYKLTELAGLIWWLAVLNGRFGVSGADFIWVSRNDQAVRVERVENLLDLIAVGCSASPMLDGLIPETILQGKQAACLSWVGALRYENGWSAEIRRRSGDHLDILRIAERNCRHYHESPCIEFSVGNGISQEAAHRLFKSACTALSLAFKESSNGERLTFDDKDFAIDKYFSTGVAPLVLEQLGQAVDRLERDLGFINVADFYSVTAPFFESIALHEWARKRNISPIMLPHSWTSSHEFSSACYRSSLTFVRSDFIMPSAHDDPGSLMKEEVISLEAVFSQNVLNSRRKKLEFGRRYRQFKLLLSLPLGQSRRTLLTQFKRVIAALLLRKYSKKRIQKAKLKIGFLLNYEHFEFTVGLDFNHLFKFIGDVTRKLETLTPNNNAVLILRRKVGWTNLHLLTSNLRVATKNRRITNLLMSPDGLSLREFGDICDVVLYFQGTSAVPELMSLGVPVVKIDDSEIPILLDEPYIVMPEEIVPTMNIENLISRLHREAQWLGELSRVQREWTLTQMTPGVN